MSPLTIVAWYTKLSIRNLTGGRAVAGCKACALYISRHTKVELALGRLKVSRSHNLLVLAILIPVFFTIIVGVFFLRFSTPDLAGLWRGPNPAELSNTLPTAPGRITEARLTSSSTPYALLHTATSITHTATLHTPTVPTPTDTPPPPQRTTSPTGSSSATPHLAFTHPVSNTDTSPAGWFLSTPSSTVARTKLTPSKSPTATPTPIRTRPLATYTLTPTATPTRRRATATPTLSPTPTRASQTSRLLIQSGEELLSWDPLTNRITPLVDRVATYTVSPNGRKIALLQSLKITGNGMERFNLTLLDVATRQVSLLHEATPRLANLSLSSDGRWLAYYSPHQGGKIMIRSTEVNAQPIEAGDCQPISQLTCSPNVTWSADGAYLIWSDVRGVWLYWRTMQETNLVFGPRVEVNDPKGNKSQVQVQYDRLEWSPLGRYVLADVRTLPAGLRWQALLDTRQGKMVPLPGSAASSGKAVSAAWMPDGCLFLVYGGEALQNRPPSAERWSVSATIQGMTAPRQVYRLPVEDLPDLSSAVKSTASTSSELVVLPRWATSLGSSWMSFGITITGTNLAPVLYSIDLSNGDLNRLRSLPYDTQDVFWSPDYRGALVLGWHNETLYAPSDSRPLVDLLPLLDAGACCYTWLR